MCYKKTMGFTLVELMITLAVTAILVTVATPNFSSFFERKRLVSAAETISQQLQYARTESIARSANVIVKFTGGGAGNAWQMGMTDKADCTPTDALTDADPCTLTVSGTPVLHRRDNTDFTDIDITSAAVTLIFNNIRGTVSPAQDIILKSTRNEVYEMQVKVSLLGQVKICSPVGADYVTGYRDC